LHQCRAREQALDRERLARLEREREEQERRISDAQALATANRRTARRTGVGLVAALVLALLAGWQWRTARNQAELAENRLDLARTNAEDLVSSITTDLRSVQGIQTTTVERLLQTAKRSFDELSSRVGADPTFQEYRAKMMSEFGETYPKIKGLDQAINSFDESLRIYRAMATQAPQEIAWQRGIANQIEHLGLVLQQQGKLELAMMQFQETLGIRRTILDRDPGAPISHGDVAWSNYNIGEIEMQRRNALESLKSDEQARAHCSAP
jgi:tetratricopeptide (TPR) repeat protein